MTEWIFIKIFFGKQKIFCKYYKTTNEITLYNVKSWVEQQVSEKKGISVYNFMDEFLHNEPY